MTTRLFCSKPFEWFEVTQLNGRGGVYLCCPSWLPVPVGNVLQQPVAAIWNSPRAQQIRGSILDGSFRYCNANRCPYLQTRTGPVQSTDAVTDPDLRAAIRERRTVLPYGPRKVICTYDQSCNLSCPSCRAEVLVETDAREQILRIQERLEREALAEADYLHITGSGDPFGSPFFRRWLQTMDRAAMPRLERIHLHSNGLLWTRMWKTIPEDVRALIRSAEISIDAARAETYALNRRGGRFADLLENLALIGGLRSSGTLDFVKISMVVQANNVVEMPEFVRLGQRFGVDAVYFSQLVNWGTFTEDEFRSRAVHLPGHPRHQELIALLDDPIFDQPVVDLGNLTVTRRSRATRERGLVRWSRWLKARISSIA
ncbi:MAG TPA: SPASM domain-containing protein [Methylomirabilota bacterium]|nr:SPASM domain-containing protein [Methylomirabilota bacterium]